MKKLVMFLLAMVVSAGLYAAEAKELKIVMSLGESEWQVVKEQILPKFEKANNVKVVTYQIQSGDLVKKLQALDKAGKVDIDMIVQDNMQLAALVENGVMEDLTKYKSLVPKQVLPALMKVGTFGDKLFFLPFRPNVEIALYNEKKFAEYGLKPPKTWDELLNVAKVFKDKEGVGKILGLKAGGTGDSTCHLFDYIRAAGGDPLVLNDEGSVKAFEFLTKLKPYMSPDFKQATWDTTNRFTATESMYLSQNWPFAVNVIVKDGGKQEIKAYGGWKGPVRESHVLGGDVLGIPKAAKNKAVAIKFATYLMSKEVQTVLVAKLGWPSARSDAYGDVEAWQKPYFAAVNDALKYAEPRPNVIYWNTVDKALNGALREIVLNDAPVKATLDKYAAMIKEAKEAK